MPESTDKSNYKHIFKSTSLFGGAQVIQILATIIRGKFIALFLGTTGVGISGLLVSSYTMIQTISGLGLTNSAVREISKAKETGDPFKTSKAILVYYRWLIFSALTGAVLIIVLSPWLSNYVFGNTEYTVDFALLSVVIVINLLSIGCTTILQGMQKLNDLAKVSILTAILTVLVTVPIYYFFGTKGIVPALIAASLVSFIISFLYAKKIKIHKLEINIKETIAEGSEMVKLGIVMMIVSLIAGLVTFLISSYITRNGSLKDVGLYQAGMNLTNQSIGLVFTAMSVDYFPRLSAVSTDSGKVRTLANQQAEIMLLIATPILLLLVLAAPLMIRILLSAEFLPITNFIRWIAIGMFFQAANYSMGLISFAKGDKKTFLVLGIVGNGLLLFFSVAGYILNGLFGVGMLFVIHSIVCYLIVYFTAYKKYSYTMSSKFMRLFILSLFPLVVVCSLVMLFPSFWGYFLGSLAFGLYLTFSVYELNRLINLKHIILLVVERLRWK